jgi:hypothetical protein
MDGPPSLEDAVRPWRLAAGAALLAVAVVALLLAGDLRRRADAVRTGDARLAAGQRASWHASATLPGDPALRLLGVGEELAFRAEVQRAVAVRQAGEGFDNGRSESRDRAELEALLADHAGSGDARLASAADNLAGILAYDDTRTRGVAAGAPIDVSVAAFGDAIRRDPANDDAKFNLELLLQRLVAKGVRPGATTAPAGPASGRTGAGAGTPGRGY